MARFTYTAKAGPDKVKTGTIEAENETVVIKTIRQNGLYPISIKAQEQIFSVSRKKYPKIKSRDLSAFTRQLANLVCSGLSLSRALSTLSSQTQNPRLKQLIEGLQQKLKKGFTFSEALSLYSKIFSGFYINMVKIGESGGGLEKALERLADFKEREDDLSSQVNSALAYPALVFIIGTITVFILMGFVIPHMVVMFSGLGQILPLSTRVIIQASALISRFWWLLLGATGAVILLGRYYYAIEKNKLRIDGIKLRLPWIGGLLRKMEIARFSYSLGVLLENGVSMLEALAVVILGVENRVFRNRISSFREKIRHGQSLSSCLKTDTLFPPLLLNMVGVGEESGELAQMLLRVAAAFEKEVNRATKTIVSLLEPLLILVIGSIIGLIVLSMLLPVFQMNILVQ